MNPLLLAYLVASGIGALLLAYWVLGRIGTVEEPGLLHRVMVAVDAGVLLGLSITIFLPIVPFLAILVGSYALLALHYRGEGRWPELAAFLSSGGATLALLWGLVVVPPLLRGAPVAGSWIGPAAFGVGVVSLTLGIATLILRPEAPAP
jgi:hypothetical protein